MIVLVHGYDGSGPGHWQHWLFDALRERGASVAFPQLPAPTEPDRDTWVNGLAAVVAGRGDRPVTFVAHSLGCWALDWYIARHGAAGLHAALLVAPPSPYSLFEPTQGFLPPPRDPHAWAPIAARTLVFGSDDDEYASDDEFDELASRLGVTSKVVPGIGHVNAASGFGPFPFALDWLADVGALAH